MKPSAATLNFWLEELEHFYGSIVQAAANFGFSLDEWQRLKEGVQAPTDEFLFQIGLRTHAVLYAKA